MTDRQTARHTVPEIEVDFSDRSGPVLTDAEYARALRLVGGVQLELRLLARAIDWTRDGSPAAPVRPTIH